MATKRMTNNRKSLLVSLIDSAPSDFSWSDLEALKELGYVEHGDSRWSVARKGFEYLHENGLIPQPEPATDPLWMPESPSINERTDNGDEAEYMDESMFDDSTPPIGVFVPMSEVVQCSACERCDFKESAGATCYNCGASYSTPAPASVRDLKPGTTVQGTYHGTPYKGTVADVRENYVRAGSYVVMVKTDATSIGVAHLYLNSDFSALYPQEASSLHILTDDKAALVKPAIGAIVRYTTIMGNIRTAKITGYAEESGVAVFESEWLDAPHKSDRDAWGYISDIFEVVDQQEDETEDLQPDPETIESDECDYCGGAGNIEGGSKTYPILRECPKCKGDGFSEAKRQRNEELQRAKEEMARQYLNELDALLLDEVVEVAIDSGDAHLPHEWIKACITHNSISYMQLEVVEEHMTAGKRYVKPGHEIRIDKRWWRVVEGWRPVKRRITAGEETQLNYRAADKEVAEFTGYSAIYAKRLARNGLLK